MPGVQLDGGIPNRGLMRRNKKTYGVPGKKAREQGVRKRGKVNTDRKVPRIPLWVTQRLFDPDDKWHLTDEGRQWLKKTVRAMGLDKPVLSPIPPPRRLKPSTGKPATTPQSSKSAYSD